MRFYDDFEEKRIRSELGVKVWRKWLLERKVELIFNCKILEDLENVIKTSEDLNQLLHGRKKNHPLFRAASDLFSSLKCLKMNKHFFQALNPQ